MIDLLNMLRYKSESTDIDFKSAQYRFNSGTEADKSELLKDILAIANSWRDGTGYILLGFRISAPTLLKLSASKTASTTLGYSSS